MRQLLLYRFPADAEFEGRLVGALERVESGGALRIADVLFVRRGSESDDLEALRLRGSSAGVAVAPLLGFRLDATERQRATKKALDADPALVGELVAGLEPGAAVAAVLVEHVWNTALEDAVSRTGGARIASDFVAAGELAELGAELGTAVRSAGPAVG